MIVVNIWHIQSKKLDYVLQYEGICLGICVHN